MQKCCREVQPSEQGARTLRLQTDDRQTDRQTDDRQTDRRQTDRQTDRRQARCRKANVRLKIAVFDLALSRAVSAATVRCYQHDAAGQWQVGDTSSKRRSLTAGDRRQSVYDKNP